MTPGLRRKATGVLFRIDATLERTAPKTSQRLLKRVLSHFTHDESPGVKTRIWCVVGGRHDPSSPNGPRVIRVHRPPHNRRPVRLRRRGPDQSDPREVSHFSQALEVLRHGRGGTDLYEHSLQPVRLSDEHRFSPSGNLVMSNLNLIANVDNVGNERPCDTL